MAARYIENRDDALAAAASRRAVLGKDKISEMNAAYRNKNMPAILSQRVRKYATDMHFKASLRLRTRLNAALLNQLRGTPGKKGASAVRDLGCTLTFFLSHIETQFEEGMTWSNWGRGVGKWSLDHIVPLAAFDLTSREDVLRACHYTNIQPMWWEENIVKSDRLDWLTSDTGRVLFLTERRKRSNPT